jgi:RNA 2',3'-cyclic 3'-phosphodiesterase
MEDERLRLFVALELPDPVRAALGRWRDAAIGSARGMRSVDRDSLHVTMCFLGWRPARELEAIAAACEVVAAESAPHLSLANPRWLPPRRPRVLAVELDDATASLARAQLALSQMLAAGGWYEPEERPYLPHVTVARVAQGGSPPRPLPPVPQLEFDAPRVILFRSRLLRSGARYEPMTTIQMGCSRRL